MLANSAEFLTLSTTLSAAFSALPAWMLLTRVNESCQRQARMKHNAKILIAPLLCIIMILNNLSK